jgi:hypothetical protein
VLVGARAQRAQGGGDEQEAPPRVAPHRSSWASPSDDGETPSKGLPAPCARKEKLIERGGADPRVGCPWAAHRHDLFNYEFLSPQAVSHSVASCNSCFCWSETHNAHDLRTPVGYKPLDSSLGFSFDLSRDLASTRPPPVHRPVSQSISFIAHPPRAHHTTVSRGGSAHLHATTVHG